MKIVMLDGYTTNPGDINFDNFKKYGEFIYYDRTPKTKKDVLERAGDADIIITNKTTITKDIIDELTNCRYIGLMSTGYDAVDVKAARTRGITVCNVPTYTTDAVAQMTFALILEIFNNAKLHSDLVHAGEWQKCEDFCFWKSPLSELSGKAMGLIGFGRIGKAVARIANAFNMKVIAYTRSRFEHEYVQGVDLDTLLSTSDIVCLHAPLNEGTEKIINAKTISKMKTGAVIINTSRGRMIDDSALAEALKSGKIKAAGVDVLTVEPPKSGNPLIECENCIITPHISWAAVETRKRLTEIVEENLKKFLEGTPQNEVF